MTDYQKLAPVVKAAYKTFEADTAKAQADMEKKYMEVVKKDPKAASKLLNEFNLKVMNDGAIVFAMANPIPEVDPIRAADYAAVVATGRSDFPNQINNVLAFPGIFRGAFDVRASDINEEMMVAAAEALAALVGDQLSEDYIIPAAFDPRVGSAVAKAVAEAARKSGVAGI